MLISSTHVSNSGPEPELLSEDKNPVEIMSPIPQVHWFHWSLSRSTGRTAKYYQNRALVGLSSDALSVTALGNGLNLDYIFLSITLRLVLDKHLVANTRCSSFSLISAYSQKALGSLSIPGSPADTQPSYMLLVSLVTVCPPLLSRTRAPPLNLAHFRLHSAAHLLQSALK